MAPKVYLCQKLGVLAGRKRRKSLLTLKVAQLAIGSEDNLQESGVLPHEYLQP